MYRTVVLALQHVLFLRAAFRGVSKPTGLIFKASGPVQRLSKALKTLLS
jgi:hypothetical protein